jgi:soluble lytic murein transglycosylase
MSREQLFASISLVFLATLAGASAASARLSRNRSAPLPRISLAAAQKKNLSGIHYEEARGASFAQLRAQARQFVALREGNLSPKARANWVEGCKQHPERNIFCGFTFDQRVKPPVAVNVTPSVQESMPFAQASAENSRTFGEMRQVVLMLAESDPLSLSDIKESLLHKALRNFDRWDLIEPLAQAAVGIESCPSASLLVSLGQKAEEFFPERKYREIAIALFARAHECGGDNDISANKARYRRALIHVWQNECKEADPLLERLADQSNGEYVSRALFWRAHCALRAGRPQLAEAFRAKLIKENPLSYHGLLLRKTAMAKRAAEHESGVRRVLDSQIPMIRFRSESAPEINAYVRAAEVLHDLKSPELAREVLSRIMDRVGRTEVAFKLYATLLLNRSEDFMTQFRILGELFQREPELISRSTLQLYYPLADSRLDIFNCYGAKVDPLLVSALIRQESGFNVHAKSRAGALGLMQLMPETAQKIERSVSPTEILDPKTNVRLGTYYFRTLLEQYDGDAELALAAYNAGPEKVDAWLKRYPVENRMLFFDLIPFKETRDYVALIARNYFWYMSLYGDTLAKNGRVNKSWRMSFQKRKTQISRVRAQPAWLAHRFDLRRLLETTSSSAAPVRKPATVGGKDLWPQFTVFLTN